MALVLVVVLLLETMVLVVLVFVLVLVVLLVLVGAAGAGGGGGGSVGRMNFGTSFAPRSPTSFAPRHNCNKVRVLFYCIGLRATITLRGYIEKCCAKLDSSTMLAAAPPCRLDISRQNFNSIGFYCSPFRACIAKCCKKVAQDTASFCSLPCRLTDLMEICRLLSLVAREIRVGGALKMTK